MLSQLRRFHLQDSKGRRKRLWDVAVSWEDVDYPPVTHLLYAGTGSGHMALRWDAVKSTNTETQTFEVNDLEQGEAQAPDSREPESIKQSVLACRDINDALVIDLQNRRVTRANDLCLDLRDNQLLLTAADTNTRALFRRLAGGRLWAVRESGLLDWKYVEFLKGAPDEVKPGPAHHLRIARLPAGEIVSLAAALPYLHAAELLVLLPEQVASDVLELMTPERQLQAFEELHEDRAVRLLELMSPDLAADLIGGLQTDLAKTYLNRVSRIAGARIVELLRYPEETTGALMTNDVLSACATLNVAEARETLRDQLKSPDFVHFIYVIESAEVPRLVGVVPMRALLTQPDQSVLQDIMNPYLITLHALDPVRQSSYRVLGSHLAALPVVGGEGQLLGAVTVDAALNEVAPAQLRSQLPRIFS